MSFVSYSVDYSPPQYAEVRYVDVVIGRHGETCWNESREITNPYGETVMGPLIQGSTDIPLNAKGKEQAKVTAALVASLGLPTGTIYTSPLSRAAETAEIIAQANGLRLEKVEGFAACNWGVCEGRTKEYRRDKYHFDMKGNYRGKGWQQIPTRERWQYQPIPGAESMWSTAMRMRSALEKIILSCRPGEQIVVGISHQENMKAFMLSCQENVIENARKIGDLKTIEHWETTLDFANCSLHQFRYDRVTRTFSYVGKMVPAKSTVATSALATSTAMATSVSRNALPLASKL